MKPPVSPDPSDTEIAAEYVLRVLKPDAHRAAAMRCVTDPAFAAEVRYWEDRLSMLADELEAVEPKPETKTVLMRRLFGQEHSQISAAGARIWQGLAALGFAAAAALAVIAFAPGDTGPGTSSDRFVAELTVADESTRMFAVVQPASGTVDIAWTARNQPEDREIQLPVSIAVLPRGRTATLELPAELIQDLAQNSEGLTLVLSDEPIGGSPTGAPTGDILATTPISEI